MPASRRRPNASRSISPTMPPSSRSAAPMRSISSSSGPKSRWSPALSMISKPPASRPSARRRRPRSSKARRALPRTSAASSASRPRPMSASTMRRPPKPTSRAQGAPIVVKADGLALGKGVVVAQTVAEAEAAIDMMFGGGFGDAGARGRGRGIPDRRGSLVLRPVRRRDRVAARLRAGPQARLRRRHRAEHRRHGRLFAGAVFSRPISRDQAMDDFVLPTRARHAQRGTPVQGHPLSRPDADAAGPEADRIQRALRRSRMPGADAAPEVRPPAGADRGARRRLEELRPALVAGRRHHGRHGDRRAIRAPTARARRSPASTPRPQPARRFSMPAPRCRDGEIAGQWRPRAQRLRDGARRSPRRATRAYAAVDRIDWPEGFCRRDIGWRALARRASA